MNTGQAEEHIALPLSPISSAILGLPIFICGSNMTPVFISAFIRNDGVPVLTMKAVIIGGCMNVFGDRLFVFPLGMGIAGAAAATLLGTSVQLAVMCSHFFTKRCTLRLVKPQRVLQAVRSILNIGIGTRILEVGTIFLSIVMNNQICGMEIPRLLRSMASMAAGI